MTPPPPGFDLMPQRSSHGQRALPGRYFTDPEIYQQESALLGTAWLAVGPEHHFPPGATPLVVEGQRLLAVRDGQDRLRIFHNLCRHRGTVLCEEPCLDHRRVVCPYHGWSYELDGRLASAPNMAEAGDGFEVDDYPLLEVESAAWQGILFVRLDGDGAGPDLDRYLARLDSIAGAWNPAALEVVVTRHYEVDANWKLLFQNYSECYHCPTLHPPLNRLTPFRDSDNLFEEGSILGGPMRLADPEGSLTTTGKRCGPTLPGLSEECLGRVYYFSVFPNLFLSLHPDYVLLHRLLRRAQARTDVECWWLATPGTEQQALEPAVEFWDTTNRQDWWVCEQMQQGVESPAYTPGPYSDLESLLAAFDRNYLRLLASVVSR